jgi:predicted Zn-dependent protease
LAWVLYQLGRTVDAESALRSGFQLGNLSPDSSYLVAKILVEQNRADNAKQILKNALENESQGIFIFRKEAQALLDSL